MKRSILVWVIIAVCIRIPFLFAYGHFDLEVAWTAVSKSVLLSNPYTATPYYNYSPIWAWILQAVGVLSASSGIPFRILVRIPLVAADVSLAIMMVRLMHQRSTIKGTIQPECLLLFSPLVIGAFTWQGQFDSVPMLLFLLAFHIKTSSSSRTNEITALFLVSLGVAIKHYIVFLLPVFFFMDKSLRWRVALVITFPLLFIATILPYYLQSPAIVKDHVFGYVGVFRFGLYPSLDYILRHFIGRSPLTPSVLQWWTRMALCVSVVSSLYVWQKSKDFYLAATIGGLGLIGLAPGTVPQYLFWPLPFILMLARDEQRRWIWGYWLISSLPYISLFVLHCLFWRSSFGIDQSEHEFILGLCERLTLSAAIIYSVAWWLVILRQVRALSFEDPSYC